MRVVECSNTTGPTVVEAVKQSLSERRAVGVCIYRTAKQSHIVFANTVLTNLGDNCGDRYICFLWLLHSKSHVAFCWLSDFNVNQAKESRTCCARISSNSIGLGECTVNSDADRN